MITAITASVKNASGDKMKVIGSIHLFLHVEGTPQPKRINFIIADDLIETLVGCSDLISLGVLPPNYPAYLNTEEAFQTKSDTQIQEEKATEDPSLMNFKQVLYKEIRETLKEFTGVFRDRSRRKQGYEQTPCA